MKDIQFKENTKHGSIFYPFQCYNMSGDAQQLMVSIHWHEEEEWIYLQEGEIEVRVDHNIVHLHSGDFFVIASQSIHQITSLSKCHYYAFVFQSSFLNFKQYDCVESKYLLPLLQGKQKIEGSISVQQHLEVKQLVEQLILASQAKTIGWELQVKAILLLLIVYFYRNEFISSYTNEDGNQTLKDMYTYLHEHYDSKITLQDLASHMHLNEQYICRYFKMMSGKSVIQYLNEYRIEEACKLLETSEDSIVDIAYQCGYENISYFILRFKKSKDMTPFVYRKLKRKPKTLK